jgi:hypothetical protein
MEIKLSQSLMRAVNDPSKCEIVTVERYFKGWQTPDDDIKTVFVQGLIFETNVLGANRSGKIYEFPRLLNGGISSLEKKMNLSVSIAKQILFDVKGIYLLAVQPEIVYGHYVGHYDAVMLFEHEVTDEIMEWRGEEAKRVLTADDFAFLKNYPVKILDTKFTNANETDKINGWGDPQHRISNNPEQPLLYSWLWQQLTGYLPAFYFYVHGVSNWTKFIRVQIKEETMGKFVGIDMPNFERKLEAFSLREPIPIGKNKVCQKCYFYETCPVATRFPETEIVEI